MRLAIAAGVSIWGSKSEDEERFRRCGTYVVTRKYSPKVDMVEIRMTTSKKKSDGVAKKGAGRLFKRVELVTQRGAADGMMSVELFGDRKSSYPASTPPPAAIGPR